MFRCICIPFGKFSVLPSNNVFLKLAYHIPLMGAFHKRHCCRLICHSHIIGFLQSTHPIYLTSIIAFVQFTLTDESITTSKYFSQNLELALLRLTTIYQPCRHVTTRVNKALKKKQSK